MKYRKRLLCMIIVVTLVWTATIQGSTRVVTAKSSTGTVYVKSTQSNKAAQKVLKLINKARTSKRLGKVKLDQSLTNCAVQRATELTVYIPTTSPHMRPNGEKGNKISSRTYYEICAESTGSFDPDWIVDSWMHSKSHREGILLKSAKSVGIACVTAGCNTYYVVEFSSTSAKKILSSTAQTTSVKKVIALNKYLKARCFDLEKTSIKVGDSFHGIVTYKGDTEFNQYFNAINIEAKSFYWKSSNPSIATVSSAGVIKAKKPGTVKITVQLKNGTKIKKTATCKIEKE